MLHARFGLISACLLLPLTALAATTYGISPSAGTRVGFSAKVSAMGVTENTVTGWSQTVKGPTIAWSADQTKLDKPVTFTVPTASFSTKLALRDHDIQQILEASRFPTVRFVLQGIDGLTAAELTAGRGDFTATGELTAHGVSHGLRLPCTFVRQGARLQVQGQTGVTWGQFGLKAPTAVAGTVRAQDTFQVMLESSWDLDTLLKGK